MGLRRDETDAPIGPLPEQEMPTDQDTDPVPFRDTEVTKRRCGTCGAEIGPDEAATLRGERTGEVRAYEKVHAFLVAQHVSPAAAARTVEAIRKFPAP